MYKILHTEVSDLPQIFSFFDESIRYQEAKGYPAWKNYDRSAILRDIENKSQYKIVADGIIAMVFSVCYTDKLIWRDRESGDALYLHRIVVNPAFKGKKLFGEILQWSITHAKAKALSRVRMDTWAVNTNIIEYYKGFGFRFIENYTTPDSPELPVHNRGLQLALMEYVL